MNLPTHVPRFCGSLSFVSRHRPVQSRSHAPFLRRKPTIHATCVGDVGGYTAIDSGQTGASQRQTRAHAGALSAQCVCLSRVQIRVCFVGNTLSVASACTIDLCSLNPVCVFLIYLADGCWHSDSAHSDSTLCKLNSGTTARLRGCSEVLSSLFEDRSEFVSPCFVITDCMSLICSK